MKAPLDSLYQPETPNARMAYLTRAAEYISLSVLFIDLLFTLQSWPFAEVLRGGAMLGLGITYGILFPVRLTGLKPTLEKDYFLFLAAGLSLGLAFGMTGLMSLIFEVYYSDMLFTVIDVVRVVAIGGTIISLFYFLIRGYGQPNTLYYAIATWLRIRLLIVSLWMGWGLIAGLAFR